MDNIVNKTNLVHNLFLVYLSISTCFGRLWAHHQEKQMCFCDTWYLLFCVDDCQVCRMHSRQSSTQNNKYHVSQKHICFSWWWTHSRPKHVEIDKYTKNKLCTKLVLFTRLYRDARSTKNEPYCYGAYTIVIILFNLENLHMSLVCLRLAIVLLEYGWTSFANAHIILSLRVLTVVKLSLGGLVESCSIWVIGSHK